MKNLGTPPHGANPITDRKVRFALVGCGRIAMVAACDKAGVHLFGRP